MQDERIARTCICCNHATVARSPAILMPFVAHRVFGHTPVAIDPAWGLRDLQAGMAYTLCNSLQCPRCGVLFLDYRFSDQEMAALYADYRGPEYTRLRKHYEPGYADYSASYTSRARYIDDVDAFLRPYLPAHPVVLDWGGDSGINTPLRDSAGQVYVHDISECALVEGVQRADLLAAAAQAYDLIVCSQVLEHVAWPARIVQELVSLMQHDTLLYVEVPYEGLVRSQPASRALHAAKHHWHEHINFFTADALQAMMALAGLETVAFQEVDIALGWRDSCIFSMLCRRA